ncbi:cytidine deaminase [Sporichthya brevicatena]|uniref:Cytidine deaminase n=1 Tax=Sporichthya brevicatena TaxID=171442 RepID=A0ABN1G9L4_9ACTN
MNIDWAALRTAAHTSAAAAYAPYSSLQVGAAGLTEDGRVVVGVNVENVSYGLTLCAECGMVSALVAGGRARLRAVAVRNAAGEVLTPCGRCRQVLLEHGGPECLVDTPGGPRPLGDLLPDSFGPADLPR